MPGIVASSSSRTPGIEASASSCSASVTPSPAIWLAASTDSAVAPARAASGRSSEISRCPPNPENGRLVDRRLAVAWSGHVIPLF